jgi:formylglycine-generating enzyme
MVSDQASHRADETTGGLMKRILVLAAVGLLLALPGARADTFGSGDDSFEIEFVRIGNPGNPPDDDPNPAGAVDHSYRIGKYEVSEQMIDKANALGGLGITKDTRDPGKPATSVTWFEAATFVNWLNTSTGSVPAYKFDANGDFQLWEPGDAGYDANNLFRNSQARYFLPSVDEWHKAAYFDPAAGHYWDYPTGVDSVPDGVDFVGDPVFDAVFYDGGANPGPNDITDVGLLSSYGTAGQGGNVLEWEETAVDRISDSAVEGRGLRGGSWTFGSSVLAASNRNGIQPSFQGEIVGLRVASIVPEPTTIATVVAGLLGLLGSRKRDGKQVIVTDFRKTD